MIQRDITKELFRQLKEYPVITVLGPRQAGKTTLVRELLSDYEHVNLESPEVRQFAIDDPKAFLRQYKNKVIFDEVQRTPHLLSYIQGIVDESNQNGQFVLTGPHQLELKAAITQSLAGRTGSFKLITFVYF
jgi:predicted AAA+ superfamily ATPase